MQATRTDRLKIVILLLAIAGLTSGLTVWFAGRPEVADMIWVVGVAPALVVEILRSLRSSAVGLDIVAALTFAAGAVPPLIVALLVPETRIGLLVAASSIIGLAVLGELGASAGGAGVVRGAVRVTFWGALAMGQRPWWGLCSASH